MVTVVTIKSDGAGGSDGIVTLRGRVENPRPILKQIGALVESASLAAFREQALGDIEWPERYPNQDDPFVNIAGLIGDLEGGGAIKARRFERRPALIDRGLLKQSPKSDVVDDKTVVTGVSGPAAEYAETHQHGLVSSMPVSKQTKQKLAKLMLKGNQLEPYRRKLLSLLRPNLHVYHVEAARRPFLGVTDKASKEILDAVENYVATGETG